MKIENYLLKNFIDLSENEKLMVLKWRNHSNIRLCMYNQNIIDKESHLNFINRLKNDNQNKYFLIIEENKYVGVVYFNNIDYKQGECEFGLYANPFEKIVGIGMVLERICINYAFDILKLKKLKLEVFSKNMPIRLLHNEFGFKKTKIKVINDKEIICMELKKVNK